MLVGDDVLAELLKECPHTFASDFLMYHHLFKAVFAVEVLGEPLK